MDWTLYAQNPEDVDEQGIYLKAEGEGEPWTTETDCEEFDGFNDPARTGIIIRDLASAQRWADEVFCLAGTAVEFKFW